MIKNILACRCSSCGDTYDIGEVYKNMTDLERVKFALHKQTCLRCGKEYIPFGHVYNMDEFVFNSVRNCKM